MEEIRDGLPRVVFNKLAFAANNYAVGSKERATIMASAFYQVRRPSRCVRRVCAGPDRVGVVSFGTMGRVVWQFVRRLFEAVPAYVDKFVVQPTTGVNRHVDLRHAARTGLGEVQFVTTPATILFLSSGDARFGVVSAKTAHGRAGNKLSYRSVTDATALVHHRPAFSSSWLSQPLLGGQLTYATRMHFGCLCQWLRPAGSARAAVASGAGRCVRPRGPMGATAKPTAPRAQVRR
jgi:hypothetical protein